MSKQRPTINIQAVIILFNPKIEDLQRNIQSLLDQVSIIHLIDNTPVINDLRGLFSYPKLNYQSMNGNIGVAKAQNEGIRLALSSSADFVLIMDQDSCPSKTMVKTLHNTYTELTKRGYKMAAIGPNPINAQSGNAYKPRIRTRRYYDELPQTLNVTQLISSGSLIHKEVFQQVGLMDENLFIDGVDHEWCWRAGSLGYKCAIAETESLVHMLGEGDRTIAGVKVAITTPFRIYFQYRNFIYLCKRSYVPTYWKINNGIKYAIKFFYYPICVSPRLLYLRKILKGIFDGFSNKY